MGKKDKNIEKEKYQKKDDAYYDKEMQDLKKEKRALCSSISKDDYGQQDFNGDFRTNQQIKKAKEEIKNKRRAIKRSQKQQWQKEIDDAVDDFYNK
jgi:hypothetical protein